MKSQIEFYAVFAKIRCSIAELGIRRKVEEDDYRDDDKLGGSGIMSNVGICADSPKIGYVFLSRFSGVYVVKGPIIICTGLVEILNYGTW